MTERAESSADTQLAAVTEALRSLQNPWSRLTVAERVEQLRPVVARLREQRESLARAICAEMGKPIALSRVELDRSADEFDYMLSIAVDALATHTVPQGQAPQGVVRYDALGIIAVISPWNFPLMLPLRSIVPALLAGNAVLFKPSELSPHCGELLVEVFGGAGKTGLPLRAVFGGAAVGAAIVKLPLHAICFTGSSEVGKSIAAQGAATLKRVVLELGGIDAALVLPDADITRAAQRLVHRNAANSGQVCNAVKRVYVHHSQYEEFIRTARAASEAIVIGEPLEEATQMGPLVSEAQMNRVFEFIADATARGAKIVSGGRKLERAGCFMQHTILSDVPSEARILHEEAFGPVLPVMAYDTVEEAVCCANSNEYGLMASIWTEDAAAADRLIPLLEVGTVSINDHVAGGPGTPWGGAKQSGLGRMKTEEILRELSNTKFVRKQA